MTRLTNRHLAALALLFGLAIWGSIAMSGCYNPWDPIPEQRGIAVADEQYREGQLEALLRFQIDVEQEFGYDFNNLWEEVTVYWVDTRCGDQGNYGILYNGKCYAGLHFSCHEMYVAVSGRDEDHICHTALMHEYAHCLSNHMSLEHRKGNGDHSGPIWDLLPVASKRECEGRP